MVASMSAWLTVPDGNRSQVRVKTRVSVAVEEDTRDLVLQPFSALSVQVSAWHVFTELMNTRTPERREV